MGKLVQLLRALYFRTYCIVFGKYKYALKLGVRIGKNCRIYIRDWGSEPELISIGNNVTIASGTKLITHDGSLWLFRDAVGRHYRYERIKIGNNVFIGMNTLVLPGCIIGDNVIVGAGSVVTKKLDSGYVYAGNPAKVITTIDEFKLKINNKYTYVLDSVDVNKRIQKCLKK